jgi:hypothetical protein
MTDDQVSLHVKPSTPDQVSLHVKPSTPRQRLYARVLMRDRDLSTIDITLQHRKYFIAAGLEEARQGRPVDDVLEELSTQQISALIQALDNEVQAQ